MLIRFLKILLIILPFSSFWTSIAAHAETTGNFTYLLYIEGLKKSDVLGNGLPNLSNITDNSISYDNVSQPPDYSGKIYSLLSGTKDAPSLTQSLSGNGIDSIIVDGSGKISKSFCQKNNLNILSGSDDAKVLDQFFSKAANKDYGFVIIYLDCVDAAETSEVRRWSAVDNQIGRVLNHLINSGKIENSTIIVTGNSDQTPLILFRYNPNFKANYYYCNLQDLGPTICRIFGIEPSLKMPGSVLYEFFTGPGDPLISKRINDLQKQQMLVEQENSLLMKNYGLLESDKNKIVEERLQFDNKLSEKDKEINALNLKHKALKTFGFLILLLFLAGYFIEYRILRKKFLIFP